MLFAWFGSLFACLFYLFACFDSLFGWFVCVRYFLLDVCVCDLLVCAPLFAPLCVCLIF